jgi:hypothetical protein
MSYTPTTWVEKVTHCGPTNMNKLENGLQAAAAIADSASTTATAAAAAAAAIAPAIIYRKNTTTDIVSATTGDLTAAALTIAAGAIGANGIVRVTAWGDYLNHTGVNQTVNVAIKFGSNSGQLFQITAVDSASRFSWRVAWDIDNQNATNVQQQGGSAAFAVSGSVSTFVIGSTAMAVDTTAAVAVKLNATLGASDANLSLRLHGAIIQVFPAS